MGESSAPPLDGKGGWKRSAFIQAGATIIERTLNSCHVPADTIPMGNYVIKDCQGCHQPLRIPADIGGMLMRCPNCGHEFHTDFKLGLKVREGEDGKEPARKTPAKKPPSSFQIIV